MASLGFSVFSIIGLISGSRRASEKDIRIARYGIVAVFIFLTISSLTLLYYLVSQNFQMQYVATYTNRSLPLFYTISAFWVGAQGSLLLWAWLLAIFTLAIMLRGRRDDLMHYAMAILLFVNSFFLLILSTVSNPFEQLHFVPPDGMGLNPLLQNWWMAIHPPTLFVGYAGLTIPYAFAVSGLILNDERWVFRVRKWTLFSWLFLGLGIVFGAAWSYLVLGWGGYWAWDPVENSSLLPWLTSTALLHSTMIQEARRGMKLWNILLSLITFEFIIFATFLTRSGILTSVHAFGESAVGSYFMIFMFVILFFTLFMIFRKYGQIKSRDIFESALSKEATFLLNNLLFVLSALTIWWGTIFPIVHEAVQGTKITVGPGFYNQTQAPLFLLLIILVGLCVVVPWRRASLSDLKHRLKYPLLVTVVTAIVTLVLGYTNVYALVGIASLAFASSSTFQEYFLDYRSYRRRSATNVLKSLIGVVLARKRRYGGYIVHLAVLLMCLGIIGSQLYAETYSFELKKGETATAAGYTFLLKDNNFRQDDVKASWSVVLEAYQRGRYVETLEPSMDFYQERGQYFGDVDILSSIAGDIVVILSSPIGGDGVADINIKFMPLVHFIWIGGMIMVVGVIVALLPRRRGGALVK